MGLPALVQIMPLSFDDYAVEFGPAQVKCKYQLGLKSLFGRNNFCSIYSPGFAQPYLYHKVECNGNPVEIPCNYPAFLLKMRNAF